MATTDERPTAPLEGTPLPHPRGASVWYVAFVVLAIVAIPALLAIGHYRWFHLDDWEILTGRDGGQFSDLIRPHNGHWSTIPTIVFRTLWHIVGLRSYVPYQAVTVATHVAVAVLLYVVMVRAAVAPAVSTAAAALFLYFGAGWENIVWAFQVGAVGAVALGLGQLILADHDAPIGRRDVLGLVAGFAGLLCSAVAVAMVATVGLAAAWRRGVKVAAFHVVPLAVAYGAWHIATRDEEQGPRRVTSGPFEFLDFVRVGAGAAFDALTQLPFLWLALLALAVAGLWFSWQRTTDEERKRRLVAPLALFAGGLVYLATAASQRAGSFGAEYASSSRYVYVTAALMLPALSVGVDGAVRRVRGLAFVAVALVLCGVTGNLLDFRHVRDQQSASFREERATLLAIADAPELHRVPPEVRPYVSESWRINVGWLRDAVADGRVPEIERTPVLAGAAALRLRFEQQRGVRPRQCAPVSTSRPLRVAVDDVVGITGGPVHVSTVGEDGTVTFDPRFGQRLYAWEPLRVTFASTNPRRVTSVCIARGLGALERAVREQLQQERPG